MPPDRPAPKEIVLHYYKFNIADYRKDTAHLSRLEHGIYRDLIDWYFLDEKPIPLETQSVMRRLRLDTDEEATALQNVLNDFFVLSDGYRHKRIDKEIADYYAMAEKNRENGKQGGRPKKTQSVSTGLPLETQTKANQEPRTKNQSKPFVPSEFIEQFWPIYPKKEGKAEAVKAFVKANINGNLPAVLTALKRQIVVKGWDKDKTYCPLASTWLNGKRWEDELEQAEQYRGNEV